MHLAVLCSSRHLAHVCFVQAFVCYQLHVAVHALLYRLEFIFLYCVFPVSIIIVINDMINPRRAHALARVTVVGLSVCLSGLNLLLHASRATRYYTYVFFTMNARFNMCGVR